MRDPKNPHKGFGLSLGRRGVLLLEAKTRTHLDILFKASASMYG
jgi:hypothetical protein